MKIAVVGSFELGHLTELYEELKKEEKSQNVLIDLVLICGNFLAIRNKNDLKCIDSCSFVENLNDFHEFYSGKRKASHLTFVIGGNYQVSNYFKTLPYGGWIAPNIFYLGNSNVVQINGLKIGAISGINDKFYDHIFKTEISKTGYYESLPLDKIERRSICYTRYLDIYRMLQIDEGYLDILLTFDWPLGILNQGETEECLKNVPFAMQNDGLFNDLGNEMYKKVLDKVKPKHYFAAKLDYKFDKIYNHTTKESTDQFETHFHSLKRFRPSKKFEIFDIEGNETNDLVFKYDQAWLKILKLTNQYVNIEKEPVNRFPEFEDLVKDNLDLEKFIKKGFKDNFEISKKFSKCLPIKANSKDVDKNRVKNYLNEQTTKFCRLLEITDPNQLIIDQIKKDLKSHKDGKRIQCGLLPFLKKIFKD